MKLTIMSFQIEVNLVAGNRFELSISGYLTAQSAVMSPAG